MFTQFFSHRSHLLALLILLAVSALATQLPLLNYLGYEFSALIAVCWSLITGLLTISLWNKSPEMRKAGFAIFVVRSLGPALAALLIPLIIITLNAAIVRNCSILQGLVLFILVTIPGVMFAHSLSAFVCVVFTRWRKTVFVVSWLLVLAHIVYVTLFRPQIFAFNPVLGFFPGLTYDETLDVSSRLLLYRVGTIAFGALLLLFAAMLQRRRNEQPVMQAEKPSPFPAFSALVLAVIVVALFVLSNRLGLSSSESFIQQELGGRAETEHFIITYPDSLLKGIRLNQVVQLHEFYFSQLRRNLRIRPEGKIHTYLYASQDQKERLIGASGTDIAKPWLGQLHINLSDVDAALQHEMVHVLAAEFGFPILRVGVNSGLTEGLAVAMERVEYEEPLHRLAAMAFATGTAPDVQGLFSLTGFMKAPAGASYTLAGSFCRYLIDLYGMRRFQLLYRTGEYTILYGKPLSSLLQDWRRMLTQYQVSESNLEKGEYLFKRRSIFGKECARVIANLNKATRTLLSEQRYDDALSSAEKSLGHTLSADAVYQKSTALVRLGRYKEAVEFMDERFRDTLASSSFLIMRVLQGDALWGADSIAQAMDAYGRLQRTHLSSSWDETLELRLNILLRAELARDLRPYFLTSLGDSARVKLLDGIMLKYPNETIPKYLLAREWSGKERFQDAVHLLDEIGPLKSPNLELARQRRLAHLSFALGQYQKAKIYYWQSLNFIYRDAQDLDVEQSLAFCDWMGNLARPIN